MPSMSPTKWYKCTETKTWVASTPDNVFPLSFLDAPGKEMSAPCVEKLRLRCLINASTGSSGGKGKALAQFLSKVVVNDHAGERVNLSGADLRIVNIIEQGSDQFLTNNNVAGNQGAANYILYLDIPMYPKKSLRAADFRMPVREFVEGGMVSIDFGTAAMGGANNWTVVSGSVELYARVVDEKRREAKSRMLIKSYVIDQVDKTYSAYGSLRYAVAYVGAIDDNAGTKWSAQKISSRTLDMSSVRDDLLIYDYLFENSHRWQDDAGALAQDDPIMAGFVLPVYTPLHDQPITEMPDIPSLNYMTDLSSLPTNSPKLIVCTIVDRKDGTVAKTFTDCCKPTAMPGATKTADGRTIPTATISAHLRNRLPAVVGGNAVQ